MTAANKLKLTRVTLFALCTLLLVSAVSAQPDRAKRSEIDHQQIVKQLNLDEATQQSLQQLMDNHRQQNKSQREKNREKHQLMRENNRAEVKALLGDEKFTKFEKLMRKQHKPYRDQSKKRGE